MKNKYIISIIIFSGLMSCSESFTDLAPISQRNAGNFYNTASDMEVAVSAIYNSLKADGCYNQSYWVLQELRSDNTFWDGTEQSSHALQLCMRNGRRPYKWHAHTYVGTCTHAHTHACAHTNTHIHRCTHTHSHSSCTIYMYHTHMHVPQHSQQMRPILMSCRPEPSRS